MHYCESSKNHPFHGPYHDLEYGIPTRNDNELFELLILEINQAGLSWLTVLKKRSNFKRAFENFDIDLVAAYEQKDIDRLLNDASIIRNRLKIKAAIENAKRLQKIIHTHGSFANLLDQEHPKTLVEWVGWFKQHFVFTGPEIVNEFLMSSGYLPGAHHSDCPQYKKILVLNPAWLKKGVD